MVILFSFVLAFTRIDIEQNFKINTLVVQFAFSALTGILGFYFGMKTKEDQLKDTAEKAKLNNLTKIK
jgi:hypothetical protein